jgi:filamentous hemagglutinin family protein
VKRSQQAASGRKAGACVALRRASGFVGAIAYVFTLPTDLAQAGGQSPLPSGGVVSVGGAAIVQPNASTLNVNQSTSKAIINWNSFSVGHGDAVNFNQPGASSATLNRVTGATPSWIAGAINAPGTVLLVNPNGVEITKSGVVNTGSFAASTLEVKNSDFLNGKYTFNGSGVSGGVINNGRINVSDGGFAVLLGGQVASNGVISARLGSVALGAGEQATLDLSGDGFLSVAVPSTQMGKLVDANGALVSNKGKIVANGGQVYLSAATAANVLRNAVNIPASVRANTVGVRNGRIVINGGAGGAVSVSGRLAANGGRRRRGGLVQVAGNDVNVTGKLAGNGASGGAISVVGGDQLALSGALTAKGKSGQGGEIDLTAGAVALTGASVDASGAAGGGDVNIGGGPHATVALADAQSLLIDESSVIRADATANGGGGHIVVWSDGLTTAQGAFSAMGGPTGGDGGLIETSGRAVDFDGVKANASAAKGSFGNWLVDPVDLTIDATAATAIQNALASTNVTLETFGDGSAPSGLSGATGDTNPNGTGDIIVTAPIAWSTSASLTLSAYRNVNLESNISTTGGSLVLYADNTGVGAGQVVFNGGSVSASGAGSTVSIFYNPTDNLNNNQAVNSTSYTTPQNFDSNVTLSNQASLTAYMLVNTVYDLQNLENNLSGAYALGTNVNASQTSGWNEIGASSTYQGFAPIGTFATPFSGVFDGQGHTIDSLTINRSGNSDIGLFGVSTGTVENVGLTNANVTGGNDVGGLVGYNKTSPTTGDDSYVANSYLTGAIAGDQHVGGLVGHNEGAISASYSAATVKGSGNYVGGLVGFQAASTNGGSTSNISITASYASGNVNATSSDFVGGLVGGMTAGSISQSDATGNVSGGGYVGGLVGDAEPTISPTVSINITDAYATGNVVAATTSYGGRLIGYANASGGNSTISETYAAGKVTGAASSLGGFAGLVSGFTITSSYWNNTDNSGPGALAASNALGLTTTEMQDAANYKTNFVGFDFANPYVWAPPVSAVNGGYPTLFATSPVILVNIADSSRAYGQANPTLTYAVHGGPGVYQFGPSGDSVSITPTTIATQSSDVATYPITWTGASPNNTVTSAAHGVRLERRRLQGLCAREICRSA